MKQQYLPVEGAFYMYFIMKEIMKCGFYDKELIGDVGSFDIVYCYFARED